MRSTVLLLVSTVAPAYSFQHGFVPVRLRPRPTENRQSVLHAATLVEDGGFHRDMGLKRVTSTRLRQDAVEKKVATSTKQELLNLIRSEPDDMVASHPRFQPLVSSLQQMYASDGMDSRYSINPQYNGDWRNQHAPAFKGRLGFDAMGDPLYTIGTLTFEQFPHANHVIVSVQKMTQSAHYVTEENACPDAMIPAHLKDLIRENPYAVRSGVLDTYFTTLDGVKGIFRMQSYLFPHPTKPNRFETWFVGGRCIPQPDQDTALWNKTFETPSSSKQEEEEPVPKKRSFAERITQPLKRLVSRHNSNSEETTEVNKLLSYDLPKPISAHQTVIYLDDDLRITIGSRNTLIIVSRQGQEEMAL